MINGVAHGPLPSTTVCQLTMRHFKEGADVGHRTLARQSFSAYQRSDRRSPPFDRIIASGGYVSVSTGSAPDGNAIPVPKEAADESMDAAACIGCGACVAACPNASASLFTGAKMTHLGVLPQGEPERHLRALAMVTQMNAEGFGGCTNIGECTGVCPKAIPQSGDRPTSIRDYLAGSWVERETKVMSSHRLQTGANARCRARSPSMLELGHARARFLTARCCQRPDHQPQRLRR